MRTLTRSAAPLLLAATAAAWGIVTAAPAAGQPIDSTAPNPVPGIPLHISTFDEVWDQFVPPNPIVPQSPVAEFGRYVPMFFPIFR